MSEISLMNLSWSNLYHAIGFLPLIGGIISVGFLIRATALRTGVTPGNYPAIFVTAISVGSLLISWLVQTKSVGILWLSELVSATCCVLLMIGLNLAARSTKRGHKPANTVGRFAMTAAVFLGFSFLFNFLFGNFVPLSACQRDICEEYDTIFGNSGFLFAHLYIANILTASCLIFPIISAWNLLSNRR